MPLKNLKKHISDARGGGGLHVLIWKSVSLNFTIVTVQLTRTGEHDHTGDSFKLF